MVWKERISEITHNISQVLSDTATSRPLSLQARKNQMKVAMIMEANMITAWSYCQSWKHSPKVAHIPMGIKRLQSFWCVLAAATRIWFQN